ncbi:hypothetical protein R1sor_025892 [Riccia sorocarpa]|uniref:MADF domain-containing protein n=1 Tax=Riccia sorocarpa TaxID=122646 RepID=A0ABD3GBX7_9MARC
MCKQETATPFWSKSPSIVDSQESMRGPQGTNGEFSQPLFHSQFDVPPGWPEFDIDFNASMFDHVNHFPPHRIYVQPQHQSARVREEDNTPDDLNSTEPENNDGTVEDAGRGKKWRSWEIIVLLEAKLDEVVERSSTPVRGIVGKWNVLVREYRKIIDHNARSGQQPWESMTPDERKEANLPITFEIEHLRILDSFIKDRAGQNPGSIADSSINLESNVDDSNEPTSKEEKLNYKRKRPVGENTQFLVDCMRESMKELGDVMRELEAQRLDVDQHSQNCSQICMRMITGAMARVPPAP